MEILISVISSLLLPWFFGTVTTLACLKRRYGYFIFALGCGFIIGLPLFSIIVKSVQIVFPDINNLYLLGAGLVLTGFIGSLMPAKRCSIEEQRLERAPSNFSYLMVVVVTVVLLLRFVFIHTSVIDISDIYRVRPIVTDMNISLTTFITGFNLSVWLQQSVLIYNEFGVWSKYLSLIPFTILVTSVGFIIFGGLRYLGCRLLPSALAAYMMLSMPIVGDYLDAKSIHVIMLSALYLLVLMLLVNGFARAEKKILLLFVVVLFLLSNHSFLLFTSVIAVLVVVVCRNLSLFSSFILVLFFVIAGGWQFTQNHHFETVDVITFQQFGILLYDNIFVGDDWHLLGVATIISLLVLLFSKRDYGDQQIALCLVAALYSLLMMLGFVYCVGQLGVISDTFIQQSIFLVAPVLCLIPVLVYQLVTIESDSIPAI